MGFKLKLKKDFMTRYFFNKNEINTIIFKYYLNSNLKLKYKKYIFYKYIYRFHLNSSVCRIVNRCLLTGRASGIVRKFMLSRMTFKDFADMGKICGVRRAV
jgi:small subunit ribosomal protein S14